MNRTTRPLYEIVREIDELIEEHVDEATGEISDDTLAKLEELEGERDDKALMVARFMKSKKAEAKMIKAEEEKLARRRIAAENVASKMKEYIENLIPQGTKLKDSVVNLWWSSATSLVIDDEEALLRQNKEFRRVRVEVDKLAVKEKLQAGSKFKNAHLEVKAFVVVR